MTIRLPQDEFDRLDRKLTKAREHIRTMTLELDAARDEFAVLHDEWLALRRRPPA